MEYIYSAMLLHKAGKKIEEASVKKVLEAAGVKTDESRVRALVAALEGVNIDEAIKKAAMPVAVAPMAVSAGVAGEAKPAEDTAKKVQEEKKSEEAAAAGLGALFG